MASCRDRSAGRSRHKLVSFWHLDPDVARNNETMMQDFDAAGIGYAFEQPDRPISRRELVRERAVFIRAAVEHEQIPYRQNALRDCLLASCLSRAGESDWFEHLDGPRPIDERD